MLRGGILSLHYDGKILRYGLHSPPEQVRKLAGLVNTSVILSIILSVRNLLHLSS